MKLSLSFIEPPVLNILSPVHIHASNLIKIYFNTIMLPIATTASVDKAAAVIILSVGMKNVEVIRKVSSKLYLCNNMSDILFLTSLRKCIQIFISLVPEK